MVITKQALADEIASYLCMKHGSAGGPRRRPFSRNSNLPHCNGDWPSSRHPPLARRAAAIIAFMFSTGTSRGFISPVLKM